MITAPAHTSAEPSDPTSRGWRVLARGARIQFSWRQSKRDCFSKIKVIRRSSPRGAVRRMVT